MAQASRDALEAAKAVTRAGVTSHEVDCARRTVIREAGFSEGFEHRLGYSIGIGFPPDWGEGRCLIVRGEKSVSYRLMAAVRPARLQSP